MPRRNSRGMITQPSWTRFGGHGLGRRAQGMSLIEIMQRSGHSSPTSTMHNIRIRPTQLAASFAQADHMAHMVSV